MSRRRRASKPAPSEPEPAAAVSPSPDAERWLGPLLLACAVAWSAVGTAPELWIGRVPVNDLVFHRAAAERLGTSLAAGEPFLEPWVSEWSLGYPVWRTYQPLGHLVGALVLWLARPLADPATAFAALLYLLVATFPLSVYAGARLLGLSRSAAGLAALLVFASSSTGDPGRYGLGYGSVLWRGSGLYTQIVALHLLALALGATARALDTRGRPAVASLLVALASLAHIVFGYVAFLSAGLLALVGPADQRSRRVVRLAAVGALALVLLAFFLVPLFEGREIVNHSRWEDPRKWDSYGAPFVLGELASGRLLDAGRWPVLTVLVGLGAVVALLSRGDALARRLLGLFVLWLGLFFGRDTWGHMLLLFGLPPTFHLHRLQAAFELSAVLLAGFGTTRLVALLAARDRRLGVAGGLAVALSLLPVGYERARYLGDNALWGEANLVACEKERPDLEASLAEVRAVLSRGPGRVSAGPASSWGGEFKVGDVPVYAVLTREHLDQVSFLYHAMSKPSDVMVLRDEGDPAHDVAFGVRAVVAPAGRPMPPHLRPRAVHGRFAVYEASPEGYFGLVDVGGHYTGPPSTRHEPSAAWVESPLLRRGIVVSLDPGERPGPAIARWEALPPPSPEQLLPRGRILRESKAGETYQAEVGLDRPCYVFVKMTWSPDLVATVDGRREPLVHVTPGFGAVAVPAGQHGVVVSYQPGPLKPLLLVLGVALFLWGSRALRSARVAEAETRLAAGLASAGRRLATPRVAVTAMLAVCAVVALRPLFRGRLVSGHDAAEYPPRLVEMGRLVGEGHLPPVWAPDLGAGHGQPLFEFAPPLVYAAALPLRAIGLGLADSLQLALAGLFTLGAVAVYRVGRRLEASRPAALGGALAWLLSPYVALDLFVRTAYAEAAAVAVLPLALLGTLRAVDRCTPWRLALGAAAVALVPLAHNGIALLAVPALALVAGLGGAAAIAGEGAGQSRSATARLGPVAAGGATIVLGLGLAAYFWLPALLEKGLVHTDRLREVLRWDGHFASTAQLLWSRWGHGLSVPGPRDGMSFALGPAHLALALLGLRFAARGPDPRRRAFAISFAAVAATGAWLATAWAGPVWTRVEALQYLAYPWRALALPGLCLPLLAVFAFDGVGPRTRGAFVAALVLLNLPHTEPRGYLRFDDEYYSPRSIASRGLNTTTLEEYEPRWVESRPPYDPRGLVAVTGGPLEVVDVQRGAARQEYVVRSPSDAVVETSTFYYPGWAVTVDGVPTEVSPVPVRGTMRLALPAGEHRVVLALGHTGVRRLGLVVTQATLATLGAAIAAVALWRRRRRRSPLPPGAAEPG
jgi:uncharacterized membrane protein